MKSLLEVVGRKILTEGIPVQTSGVDRILYNLKPSTSYDLPVQTSESEWIVVQGPERLVRIFKFEDPREVKDFVTHIIFEQEEMGHHAKLIVDNRGSQTFSCEIDKFKRSRNDTTILFFSSAELSSKLMKERYLLDVKIEHGESEIVSFSDVTDVNSEIEILFNSAGSHVQLTILPS